MLALKRFLTILLLTCFTRAGAQNCTLTAQTPSSAIRLCSDEPISIAFIPSCGQSGFPVACNDGNPHDNKNPTWFKLACYNSGSFGFTITPSDPADNYDWQLFDITGRNPDDVFTNGNMFVACNWSPEVGETGASQDGDNVMVCAVPGANTFSAMPNIIVGHEYLLMLSNRITNNRGFTLTASGGNASITDPVEPRLLSARLSCDGTSLVVRTNRGVKCSSLALNGSDFTISGGFSFIGASSTGCAFGPTTDSITLILNAALPLGTYNIKAGNGSDGNTLADVCNRPVPVGDSLIITVAPPQPTPMDSLAVPGCGPRKLHLVFKRPMLCSSIASNGSDFVISGPTPVNISAIFTRCNASPPGSTTTLDVDLLLSAPIGTGGNYTITLVTGSDGNTLLDECGRATPAGATLSFTLKDTVSADFNINVLASCKKNILDFIHSGGNGVNNWSWTFDNTVSSIIQSPQFTFPDTGTHAIQLIVSNGFCADTAVQKITLNNQLKAVFEISPVLCPGDIITVKNNSQGNIDQWSWNFGNGLLSTLQNPVPPVYAENGQDITYQVSLVVTNSVQHCSDTAKKQVHVLPTCIIAVPSAFTPNGDGLNDYLFPLNALKADNIHFMVFDRNGVMVFESRNMDSKWDGTFRGSRLNTGIFAWVMTYTFRDTGRKVMLKGTTLLLR